MLKAVCLRTLANLQQYAAECCLAIHDLCIPARHARASGSSVEERMQTSHT